VLDSLQHVRLRAHYECAIENSCWASETNSSCDGNTRTMEEFSVPTTLTLRLRRMRLWVPCAAFSLLAALTPCCMVGQSESASVSGRVTDQQNAVIPNVEVEIRNVDTKFYRADQDQWRGYLQLSFAETRKLRDECSKGAVPNRFRSLVSRSTYKTHCHVISLFRLDHPRCQ